MRRLIVIIFILISFNVTAKDKLKVSGIYKTDKKIDVLVNQFIIQDLTDHLYDWSSVNGDTIVEIPYSIEIKKDTKTVSVNSHWCQYEYTNYGGGDKRITIFPMKCESYEFDFNKKKIKTKTSNTSLNFLRSDEADIKEVLKDKKDKLSSVNN